MARHRLSTVIRALAAGALVAGSLTLGAAMPAGANSPARDVSDERATANNPAAGGPATSASKAASDDSNGTRQAEAQNPVGENSTTETVHPKLVIDRDFPDPDVSKFGDTFYAYATNTGGKNLPWATASDPDGPWTYAESDALPELGAWATTGKTWAPDVSRLDDGRYLLYYTATDVASGRQCIGAAYAESPEGPFTPAGSEPLVCQLDAGGSIDASSFVDDDGTRYMLWKNDGNAVGDTTWIYLRQVAADGITFQGDATQLMRNDRDDEAGIIEAPVLGKVDGQYVLFYAAGPFATSQYGTNYGVSDSITGPYTKAFRFLMTTDSLDGAVDGPGGADILRDNGGDRILFHGHLPDGGRGMYVADLGWANSNPVVRGSRVRYEAENGTLNNCQVRDNAAGASMGKVAAGIDHSDSWVELGSIYAPTAGHYSVHVGYANGSADTASHAVTVNGEAAGSISYPVTGWDNWQQATIDVELQAGWNTVRFGKGDQFAELDYVEVA